jgi:hypothetical protein
MEKPTYTTPADELLFASIGRLTISWALLESCLDGIITIIHHRVGGKTVESDMPWMLKRKVKYIRKCFSRLDALKPYLEPVPQLMTDIIAASEMRQNIIHGVAIEMPEGTAQLKIARLIRGGEFYEQKHFEIPAKDILESAVEASRLGARSITLARALIAAFGIDKFEQSFGEFPR